ncbi:hypothetical protein Y032_0002g922 [Ancylostoma ceylanicum]|uniref:Tyrosinase copper-binding domain-containing protein n=1 Tax=Ancylostoma ceylanicum TaxID=53326 RepID=A0A016W255_9BILA|nr:hypothetical protein Y032_0002g922 [Ancylostoma ceylanicum]
MGEEGRDGYVGESPFKNWTITRRVGKRGHLLRESDIETILNSTRYDQILAHTAATAECRTRGYWTAIEYLHEEPHLYVGGDMEHFANATNDPLFWNFHVMVDLIWERWRKKNQDELYLLKNETERETQYPNNDTKCSGPEHFAESPMIPFAGLRNIDGLSNNYTDNLYVYSERPKCSKERPLACNSRYLFCDISRGDYHCASKIKLGGFCRGVKTASEDENPCYQGVCRGDICEKEFEDD